jgi:hypothetical protein
MSGNSRSTNYMIKQRSREVMKRKKKKTCFINCQVL